MQSHKDLPWLEKTALNPFIRDRVSDLQWVRKRVHMAVEYELRLKNE